MNAFRTFSIFVFTALLLCSCSLPNQGAAQPTPTLRGLTVATMVAPGEAPTQPGPVSNDPCGNPYYPVVDGTKWVYSGPKGQFSQTIGTDTKGTFSIHIEAGANTFNIQGLCLEGGDISLLNVPGNSLTYSGESGASTMTTNRNEGITLPGDIQLSDDWSQKIGVEVTAGKQKMNFTIETTYTAVGYETVSVPAGTFKALKVEQSSSMGGTNPDTQTLWYAQGVGLVKSVIFVDKPVVTELVSYNIP